VTALVSVRRRWTAAALAGGFLALVALGVLGYVGVDTLANSKEGRPANTLPPGRALPPTPAGLLAVRDDDGNLTSLSVLALAPPDASGKARGGTVIPVPVGSGVFEGFGAVRPRLNDIYAEGGIKALAEQAAIMLELNFSVVAEVDQEGLQALLDPLGAVTVDVPSDVIDSGSIAPADEQSSDASSEEENDDLGAEIVLPAGVTEVEPTQGSALLTAVDGAQPESVRFEQHVAYWLGVSNRVADGLLLGVGDSPTDSMRDFLWSMFGGPLRVYALRGIPVSTGPENPDGLDMYRIDGAERLRVMATVLPDAVSPAEFVFTAQIVDPFGDPAITQAAVERLALSGVGIVLVRELSGIEIPDKTEFSLGGKFGVEDVKPLANSLGETELVPLGLPGTPHGRVQGIDATFVLGQSFVDLLKRQAAATTVPPTTDGSVTTVSSADESTTTEPDTTEAGG